LISYNTKLVTRSSPRNISSTLLKKIKLLENTSLKGIRKKFLKSFVKNSRSTFEVLKMIPSGVKITSAEIASISSQMKKTSLEIKIGKTKRFLS